MIDKDEIAEREEYRAMVNDHCREWHYDGKHCRDCPGNISKICCQDGYFRIADINNIRRDIDLLCFADESVPDAKPEKYTDNFHIGASEIHNYKVVAHIDDDGKILEIYYSMKEACDATGASPTTLKSLISEERKSSKYGRWVWLDKEYYTL